MDGKMKKMKKMKKIAMMLVNKVFLHKEIYINLHKIKIHKKNILFY